MFILLHHYISKYNLQVETQTHDLCNCVFRLYV